MNATAPARDDLFVATIGQHYPGLVRRLAAVIGDRESALDLALRPDSCRWMACVGIDTLRAMQ